MKKFLTAFVMMAMMAIMIPLLSTDASAQTRRSYRNRTSTTRVYNNRPSFYRRHRNVINMGIGTGAGAIIGGLLGGKKGAVIGALTGAGGSALYTYKIKPKQRRYYR